VVVVGLVGSASAELPKDVADVHNGRDLVFDANSVGVRASVGGSVGAFVVSDGTKMWGGGEGIYGEPVFDVFGDITRGFSPKDVVGISVNYVGPASAMVDIDQDRENRVNNRGYFDGPQLRTLKIFWRHTAENSLYEVGGGRDMFLGFEPMFIGDEYQGSMPLMLRYSRYFDNGISFRYARYRGADKLFDVRACLLDGEGWRGIEDTWLGKSYPSYGAQGRVNISEILGLRGFYGDLSLLGSWTNAEGGSRPDGLAHPEWKEQLGHTLYGAEWSRELFGLKFLTRFTMGSIVRGSNGAHYDEGVPYEKTNGWVWENQLSGIRIGRYDGFTPYFSLSNAKINGAPYWVWKTLNTTSEKMWKVGATFDKLFGVKGLCLVADYFQKDLEREGRLGLPSELGRSGRGSV